MGGSVPLALVVALACALAAAGARAASAASGGDRVFGAGASGAGGEHLMGPHHAPARGRRRAPGPQRERHNALEAFNAAAARPDLSPKIRLRVNATRLKDGRGEWFEVSWSGVAEPDDGDLIALLPVISDRPIWAAAPIKYKMAAAAASHLTRGRGRLRFRLISYRTPVRFALMRGGPLAPRLAALGDVIRVAHPNQPLQGRLALTGGGPTEMLVQWSTRDRGRPAVRWGRRPGDLSEETGAASHTYTRGELCGEPATAEGWIDPGYIHVAKLTGLEPGRRYYYKFGDPDGGGGGGFSPVFSFRAAPPEGPDTTVKFLAVADLGQAEADGSMEEDYYAPSLNTTRRMFEEGDDYQLLLHAGDVSYARGYVSQWDNFHHQMEPLTTSMPYMLAPGNHERNWPGTGDRFDGRGDVWDSGGECGVPYERRFAMPTPGPDKPWYAFTLGPVRFVQYSSEHVLTPGSEQHDFIKQELETANRSVTPWLVVTGHRPIYIASTNFFRPNGDQPVAEETRSALEGLMLDNQVDLTLHGHHHSYQRTCPVFRNRCLGYASDGTARGPVHLVIGHGGATLSPNVPLAPLPIWQSIKFWWGYLRVEASATRLAAEVISDLDGKLLDAFELTKPEGWGDDVMAARAARAARTATAGWEAAAAAAAFVGGVVAAEREGRPAPAGAAAGAGAGAAQGHGRAAPGTRARAGAAAYLREVRHPWWPLRRWRHGPDPAAERAGASGGGEQR